MFDIYTRCSLETVSKQWNTAEFVFWPVVRKLFSPISTMSQRAATLINIRRGNCVNDRNQIWFNSFHFIPFDAKVWWVRTHKRTRTSCCDASESDFRIMVTKFLRSSSEWLFKWEGETQMEFCKSFTRHTISFIKRTNPRLTTNDGRLYAIQIHFHHISHCDLAEFFPFPPAPPSTKFRLSIFCSFFLSVACIYSIWRMFMLLVLL